MAVNHADGTMFVSVMFYPIAAGVGAFHGGAGWLTVLFIPVGLALGIGIIYLGRRLIYAISGFALSCSSKIRWRSVQAIFTAPFFVLYIILPYVIIWAGVFYIWFGSAWLARHYL